MSSVHPEGSRPPHAPARAASALLSLALVAAASSARASDTDDDADGGVTVSTHLVPMRDGARLATDVYLPRPGARDVPCVLIRTPYDRERYDREYGSWATRGYAVAIQDMRGRFDSEGKAMAFLDSAWGERRDGYDTVEWLAAREFCDGRVATVGASAMGITQQLLAAAAPPSLVGQYVLVSAPSLYHYSTYPGGVLRKSQVERWIEGHAHPDALDVTLDHPLYDDHWEGLDAVRAAPRVRVPAVHYGGWYDTFCEGTLDGFVAWQERGGEGARGRQKLVMGPWTHGGPSKERLGDFARPADAEGPPVDISARRWLNVCFARDGADLDDWPAVLYYTLGPLEGARPDGVGWRTADAWPPASEKRALVLTPDGALEFEGESTPQAEALSWTHDPDDPVPTIGGRNLYLEAGPKDQTRLERRDDVLVFTSAPLEEALEVTGRVEAELTVRTDRADTDFVVRLTDVYPDGRSILVTEGAVRLLATLGGRRAEPGRTYEVRVAVGSTSAIFAPGHRVRVSVSSSSYPRLEANPGNGEARYTRTPRFVARNELLVGGEHTTRVLLPVIARRPR